MAESHQRLSLIVLILICQAAILPAHSETPPVPEREPHKIESSSDNPPPVSPNEAPIPTAQPEPPPDDPCLPTNYRNWREHGPEDRQVGVGEYAQLRILIHRGECRLTLEGADADGAFAELYTTRVGVGSPGSPTPLGNFLINHVYCYPDVVLFNPVHGPVPKLYRAFFAPILACDETGRCDRYRDMGIHGFDASAFPDPDALRPEAEGHVSGGCIRLPDPCAFKKALTRAARLGPLKRNDRGSYHWLERPIEVIIYDDKITILSLLEQGIGLVSRGVGSALSLLGP